MRNNKQEIENYLEKTSKHNFIVPKRNSVWKETGMEYTYDYSDSVISNFNVIKEEGKWHQVNNNIKTEIDVDYYIKHYNDNSLCVIKHILFIDKKMKAIKKKYHLIYN